MAKLLIRPDSTSDRQGTAKDSDIIAPVADLQIKNLETQQGGVNASIKEQIAAMSQAIADLAVDGNIITAINLNQGLTYVIDSVPMASCKALLYEYLVENSSGTERRRGEFDMFWTTDGAFQFTEDGPIPLPLPESTAAVSLFAETNGLNIELKLSVAALGGTGWKFVAKKYITP